MTWISENDLTWTQRLAMNVLKCGPIPKHIAFIMDGNRRFAVKNNFSNKIEGHIHGFDQLSKVLRWCWDLGINELTVYAFSIENFKRSDEEVATLLQLVREKMQLFMKEKDKLNEHGISLRIIGNFSLLPLDIQQMMADAVLMTKHNKKAVLNVAFAYTARDEITESVKRIVQGVRDDDLHPDDVNDRLIRNCMYTRHSPNPDLLVRTSGEARLSDFLLSQISATVIYFSKILWPEFTFWHLLAAIFYYQRHYGIMLKAKKSLNSTSNLSEQNGNKIRIAQFLDKIESEDAAFLQGLQTNDTSK